MTLERKLEYRIQILKLLEQVTSGKTSPSRKRIVKELWKEYESLSTGKLTKGSI